MKVKKARFKGIETSNFSGYTFGKDWNGWECPLFTKRVANKIVKTYNQMMQPSHIEYDSKNDCYLEFEQHYNEPIVYEPTYIEYNGKTIKVYGLGSYYWMWERA